MLTAFTGAAMHEAKYKILGDGTFWAEIPSCPGVWANEATLEKCREELREVLEEWINVGDINVSLLKEILKQAGITETEWEKSR
ncbi:hypothetical protein A6M21_05275 [Desulfotomaculum copahuensis]|uniref:Antitoxin HicB n=1 Tax=Desulfotomaculum copahuensis TaxID=1838280 RepID=A0A1B7LI06_9FIRM|nr:hypothetical protein A6M21_05275 [Desulfotomaculum copahuensis]